MRVLKAGLVFPLLWIVFSPTTASRAAEVVAWGVNYCGQTDVPIGLSNVVAIAAGYWHSLALTADGTIVSWGTGGPTTNVPGTKAVAIAGRCRHSLALSDQPTLPRLRLKLSRGLSGLQLQAHGAPGISCRLLRASRLPGPWLPSPSPTPFNLSARLTRANPPSSSGSCGNDCSRMSTFTVYS